MKKHAPIGVLTLSIAMVIGSPSFAEEDDSGTTSSGPLLSAWRLMSEVRNNFDAEISVQIFNALYAASDLNHVVRGCSKSTTRWTENLTCLDQEVSSYEQLAFTAPMQPQTFVSLGISACNGTKKWDNNVKCLHAVRRVIADEKLDNILRARECESSKDNIASNELMTKCMMNALKNYAGLPEIAYPEPAPSETTTPDSAMDTRSEGTPPMPRERPVRTSDEYPETMTVHQSGGCGACSVGDNNAPTENGVLISLASALAFAMRRRRHHIDQSRDTL